MTLPSTDDALLVRTAFGDDDAWTALREAVATETTDGFRAYVTVVDDPEHAGASWQDLRQAAVDVDNETAVLFVVDDVALRGDLPVLVVDLGEQAREPFRCIAAELWGVENNLDIANMDWEEFAAATDGDGVFRGFPTA